MGPQVTIRLIFKDALTGKERGLLSNTLAGSCASGYTLPEPGNSRFDVEAELLDGHRISNLLEELQGLAFVSSATQMR